MDPATFIALIERCAPNSPAAPLAAIVRQASEFEPLVIRTETTNPVVIQATSKAEAVQLATELVIAGHRVRIGLAQIDTRDLTRLGFSLAEGFESCAHIRAAARLLAEDPSRLKLNPSSAKGRVSAVKTAEQGIEPDEQQGTREERRVPAWDVYGQGRESSVLVYSGSR